ncbi:MAG: flagellar biosynthetic protein FliR [Alphaproteobacteria bacterium]|nr:flagellar biosynthetic protein FliR [Alphaproteobacteria bacterium]
MLEQFLITELFAFLMVFCRLGSMMMVMPGIGETYVMSRARLMLALMASLVMTPLAAKLMPEVPGSPLTLTVLLFGEILIGLFIGILARILMSAMHTAGTIIAFQSGLASAQLFDPTSSTQGSLFGNLLSIGTICAMFALDMHHVIITGVADSYTLFTPGVMPQVEDMLSIVIRIIATTFAVALAFSMPHILIGLLVNLGAGLISRVMPAMQVYFIIMPVQIMATVFLLMVTLSSGMLMYLTHVEATMTSFLQPD